jgi:gamma-glutamylcyclotransferase
MTLTYFAYGSNLHFSRFEQRVPSARVIDKASLTGYQLAFHKLGIDDSGKCNIIAGDAEVHGVVYEIATTERLHLDHHETGYDLHCVDVNTSTGPMQAYTYIAHDEKIDHSLLPYHWYKLYVLQGALSHGLDADYCSLIALHDSINDPDAERNDHHFSILGVMLDKYRS